MWAGLRAWAAVTVLSSIAAVAVVGSNGEPTLFGGAAGLANARQGDDAPSHAPGPWQARSHQASIMEVAHVTRAGCHHLGPRRLAAQRSQPLLLAARAEEERRTGAVNEAAGHEGCAGTDGHQCAPTRGLYTQALQASTRERRKFITAQTRTHTETHGIETLHSPILARPTSPSIQHLKVRATASIDRTYIILAQQSSAKWQQRQW